MPEPQPLYDAIGRVIVESAKLETAYGRLVGCLAGPLGHFFVAGVGPAQLKKPARRLLAVEHLPESLRDQCLETLQEAEALLDQRNHVAHGQWFRFPADDEWTSAKPIRHSLSADERKWSLPDLHALAHRMVEVNLILFTLTWNVQSAMSGGTLSSRELSTGPVISGHQDESPADP